MWSTLHRRSAKLSTKTQIKTREMEQDMASVEANKVKDLLVGSILHLFLPKKTPSTDQLTLLSIEQFIFQSVTQSFIKCIQELNIPELQPLLDTIKTWQVIQPQCIDDPQSFVDKFSELIQGNGSRTIPIYVRNQSSTLLFHKENDCIKMETFRTTLPPEVILENESDLFVNFPETYNIIQNVDFLKSSKLARLIFDLAVTEVEESSQEKNAEPFLVNDLLVGLLAPQDKADESRDIVTVRKKVRDQVTKQVDGIFTEGSPFRRSGWWMALKAVTQLSINKLLGATDASKVLYKTLILRILGEICEKYFNLKSSHILDFDLMSQMTANLANRVFKLNKNASSGFNEFKNSTFKQVHDVVEEIQQYMRDCITQETILETDQSLPGRSAEEYKEDLEHIIPTLSGIKDKLADVQNMMKNSKKVNIPDDLQQSLKLQRFPTAEMILEGVKTSEKSDQLRIWIYDAETFLKSGLEMESDFNRIFEIANAYIKKALRFYSQDDPLGLSQVILAFLKTLQTLDKRTVEVYPLLKSFSSGVTEESFYDLLFPHLEDMLLLEDALKYFKERNENASSKESLLIRKVTEDSFPVKYFGENEELQKICKDVQGKVKEDIQKKYEEAQRVRQECKELQGRIDAIGTCSCVYEEREVTEWRRTFKKQVKTQECSKCRLMGTLEYKARSVSLFQKPLPEQEHLQKGVIFEMYIPQEISVLRGILSILQTHLIQEPRYTPLAETKLSLTWNSNPNLNKYFSKPKPNPPSNEIAFGSSSGSSNFSPPDIRLCTDEQLISKNFLDCSYSSPFNIKVPSQGLSFKIRSMKNSTPYLTLQKYLSSFHHTQNEVICNQEDCSDNLSQEEFLAFGSARAGHRIQARNLFAKIISNLLSLEEEPVLGLILQIIWQVGPTGNEFTWEAHEDFLNDDFCHEFLNLLNGVVEANKSNYSRPCVLLGAVAVTVRISELNERVSEKCYKILRNWRELFADWTEKIQGQIYEEQVPGNVKDLERNLLILNICLALSFSTQKKWSCVMKDEKDVLRWLYTLHLLHQKAPDHAQNLSQFMQILLNHVQNISLKISLENEAVTNPIVKQALIEFVSQRWTKSAECEENVQFSWKGEHLKNLVELKYILTGNETSEYQIYFDFLLGTFLVNGFPVSHLPIEVTRGKTFTRFFGSKNSGLAVQPESNAVFRTVRPFHGAHYEFWTLGENLPGLRTNVIIVEIAGDLTKRVLLEQGTFWDFIQPDFITGYTHWLDLKEGSVYFRKSCNEDSDYDLEPEYKLTTLKNTWHFSDLKQNSYLLSIKSTGFLNIANHLERLELPEYINIFCRTLGDSQIELKVYLPRFKLWFEVDSKSNLMSLDYPGYIITGAPDGKTLAGLKQGLVMQKGEKKVLLIPHGDIYLEESDFQAKTQIDLEVLHEPPYFIYEYDSVLKRLIGNKSKLPYLYLAGLHAVTSLSSGQPDPFTGVTGMEMAMRILQSGFIWSSSPYDESCLRIFEFIRSLSPKRKFEGDGKSRVAVEVVQWPEFLPSMSAYDGFAILVDNLIAESNKLNEGTKLNENTPSKDQLLQGRGYRKSIKYYNDLVRLNSSLEKIYPGSSSPRIANKPVKDSRSTPENFEKLCKIVHLRFFDLSTDPKATEFQPSSVFSFICNIFQYPIETSPNPVWFEEPSTSDILNLSITRNWFQLYELAKRGELTEIFSLILCNLAYKGVPIEQVLNLHYLGKFADKLKLPDVPKAYPTNIVPHKGPTESEVESAFRFVLKNNVRDRVAQSHGKVMETSKNVDEKATELKNLYWTERPSKADQRYATFENFKEPKNLFNEGGAFDQISAQIIKWHREQSLREFAREVGDILATIQSRLQSINLPVLKSEGSISQVEIGGNDEEIDSFQSSKTLIHIFSPEALEISLLPELKTFLDQELEGGFKQQRLKLEEMVTKITSHVEASVTKETEAKILKLVSLSPRMDPTSLLQNLLEMRSENKESVEVLKQLLAGLALIWSNIKQVNRCIFYDSTGNKAELERELENKSLQGAWNSLEYPEWLCLELELDIRIRKKQVEVAQRMIEMPDGGDGVMQLNMGEGKTSVIVPMLCSTLSTDKICRVTILASMLNMNYKILSFAIGGLLNKRVYVIPCRRDMGISEDTVQVMNGMYEECLKQKGVVLALPEHRLSFRLLGYDKMYKGNFPLGKSLWKVENWLRDNVRDVMDESDELFNAKYQLVYTVGGKMTLDGNHQRWFCCQKLLEIVSVVGHDFRVKFGEKKLEYNTDKHFNQRHQFADIRLLDNSIQSEFVNSVADKLLEEFTLGRSQKPDVKKFLTENIEDSKLISRVFSYFDHDKEQLNQVLIYSGYLRRGILTLGLSKRWRVEYGVDRDKTFRLMAVPFRAKDFPAERTEFGHPDLGILLTHLSYYYSGLSDKQLKDILKFLKKRPSAESIYGSWLDTLQKGSTPGHLKSLNGINLKDSTQRNELFKLLKHHTLVINFWLSNKVFPRECKQFPSKLVMTPWDLCFERNKHPTTGFSGTNDSSILLPLQILQQDLPSLLETNKEMERTLLQPENKGHRYLNMGVTCKEVLQTMEKEKLKVLIDAGALMLDLDNEQVANTWLDVDSSLEGVLYFNKNNDLTVKLRNNDEKNKNLDVPYELTPYQSSLEKIGVFLDDQHTRGTDLKFPTEWRAVVTIGAGMRRDKLIQACMRMRKLGKGQSVTFYLSMDVFNKIVEMIQEDNQSSSTDKLDHLITTKAVLEWVKSNTKKFNDDGLLYWAIAGKNYAQRLAAEDIFNAAWKNEEKNDNETLSILANQCVDDEVTKLMSMYGQVTCTDTLVSFIPSWFDSSWAKLKRLSKEGFLSNARQKFEEIRDGVLKRCNERIPSKMHVCSGDGDMEDEEEKELEEDEDIDAEERCIIDKPRRKQPALHNLHKNVVKIVETGEKIQVKDGIKKLSEIFKNTSFSAELQTEAWSQEVFASSDFISVVNEANCVTDDYLRPMEYFVLVEVKTGRRSKVTQVLFLSPYEVNQLVPRFRSKDNPTTLHMFTLRRSEEQSLLWDKSKLVLPTGKMSTSWKLSDITISSILLASGNLYFGTMDEQKNFAAFLCLALKPWGEEEQKALEEKKITKSGFMVPGYEGRQDFNEEEDQSFQTDPSYLARRILDSRHSTPTLIAHVIRILNEKTSVDLK